MLLFGVDAALATATIATECFLALREPPNSVNYNTKRLRLAKYPVNCSIRAPWGRVLGSLWGSLAGVEGLVTAFLRRLSKRSKRLM